MVVSTPWQTAYAAHCPFWSTLRVYRVKPLLVVPIGKANGKPSTGHNCATQLRGTTLGYSGIPHPFFAILYLVIHNHLRAPPMFQTILSFCRQHTTIRRAQSLLLFSILGAIATLYAIAYTSQSLESPSTLHSVLLFSLLLAYILFLALLWTGLLCLKLALDHKAEQQFLQTSHILAQSDITHEKN